MSTPTDSRPSRHILLDVAFWLILVILVALPVVTSITLCSGALSSKMDTLACAGVTSALAVFLVCIGTIYATLGSRDAPAACILINLAGIVLGWPISNVLSLPARYGLFTVYVIAFETPYLALVERAASPQVRATLLRQLPNVWPHQDNTSPESEQSPNDPEDIPEDNQGDDVSLFGRLHSISKKFHQAQSYRRIQDYERIPMEEPSNDSAITLV